MLRIRSCRSIRYTRRRWRWARGGRVRGALHELAVRGQDRPELPVGRGGEELPRAPRLPRGGDPGILGHRLRRVVPGVEAERHEPEVPGQLAITRGGAVELVEDRGRQRTAIGVAAARVHEAQDGDAARQHVAEAPRDAGRVEDRAVRRGLHDRQAVAAGPGRVEVEPGAPRLELDRRRGRRGARRGRPRSATAGACGWPPWPHARGAPMPHTHNTAASASAWQSPRRGRGSPSATHPEPSHRGVSSKAAGCPSERLRATSSAVLRRSAHRIFAIHSYM